jgi:hypothetical protein
VEEKCKKINEYFINLINNIEIAEDLSISVPVREYNPKIVLCF